MGLFVLEVRLGLGQSWNQLCELTLALLLTSLVGLERNMRGKGAGLRTQSIVGVASALFLQVGKYGFFDLVPLMGGDIRLDPSRVASQVVSGVGFLGAGLIMTQHSRVRGLTTAASVWESSAIGMAAGAGLWVLAVAVTAMHFLITFGFNALERILPTRGRGLIHLDVTYCDGLGLLRTLLSSITRAGWAVERAVPRSRHASGSARLILELEGPRQTEALMSGLADLEGVLSVEVLPEVDIE
ncbi:putative Mg(2+) transport ATPase [Acidipropionibacterium jensenii]|uniref:Putative Mg(2+) transport ATPase n=1 Tax=Acidipropionibacterium jensenii TaxID=1749 RepID=A0A3S4VHU9_9ACTN|nr:MgtC/SapB family protein [Acidipropionibacterium jensenii]VEI02345.1 putative Mg(2+) transport ATPase [Acidipropionibacterium jensenii]